MQNNLNDISFMQDRRLRQSELIYDGAILQLFVNQVEIAENVIVPRELIHHQTGVAILAITDHDEVLLVKQYRAAVSQDLLEIPAGLADLNASGYEEAALVTAQRELEEETTYQASKWQEIGSYYLSPGYLDEQIIIFKAEGLSQAAQPLSQDEHENVSLVKMTKTEVSDLLRQGEIKDLKTVFALNYWLSEG